MEKDRGAKIRKKRERKFWICKGMKGSSGKAKLELQEKEKGIKSYILPWLVCET